MEPARAGASGACSVSMTSPTEQLVEVVATVTFGAIGATIKRVVEVHDAPVPQISC